MVLNSQQTLEQFRRNFARVAPPEKRDVYVASTQRESGNTREGPWRQALEAPPRIVWGTGVLRHGALFFSRHTVLALVASV